ncbi:Zn-ribbon domain-containing OB-fold protein [Rhodococcus koreensis]
MSGPVPQPTPETLPFWEGTAQQELRIQRCAACELHYFYPRPFCPLCGADDVHWLSASGKAELVSYVIDYRPLPPFPPKVPIVIALVELEEGPRMMSNIVGVEPDPANFELGMKLFVQFVERGDQTLPMFTPAAKAV